MKRTSYLLLIPALAASALAQSVVPPSGNTGSAAGVSGGPGLGDTPSTAPTGTSTGSIPVRRAEPVAPAPGTDASTGVTRSTGAGIIDGSTRQPSGASGSATTTPTIVVPSGTGAITTTPSK